MDKQGALLEKAMDKQGALLENTKRKMPRSTRPSTGGGLTDKGATAAEKIQCGILLERKQSGCVRTDVENAVQSRYPSRSANARAACRA